MSEDKNHDELLEFDVELEERKVAGGFSGHYKVIEKSGNSKDKRYSTFQSTLGIAEEDWEAYIQMSDAWKLPLSDNLFDVSISTNCTGERTTTIVWNTFKSEDDKTVDDSDISENSDNIEWERLESLLESLVLAPGSTESSDQNKKLESNPHDKLGSDNTTESIQTKNMEPEETGELVEPVVQVFAGSDQLGEKDTGGYTCSVCGITGIKDNFNLGRHISRMHSGSFKCSVCNVEFNGRFSFNVHYKDCYHYCPFEGCPFKEKRQSRMDGHIRKHSRLV